MGPYPYFTEKQTELERLSNLLKRAPLVCRRDDRLSTSFFPPELCASAYMIYISLCINYMWDTANTGVLVGRKGGRDAFSDIINRVENIEWCAWHRPFPPGVKLMEKMTITAGCDDTTWNSARIRAHCSKMEHKESSNYILQIWQERTKMSMTVNYDYIISVCHNCESYR